MNLQVLKLLIHSAGILFTNVKGNARILVITEGISNVAFQWYSTYLSLYMVALGLNEVTIGWLASALLLTQIAGTLMGGAFADRFGRKRVLVIGDIVCWGIPLLLYAVAQNPWYLVIGRLLNGFIYIVFAGFECLFVEDVSEDHRPAVYAMLQFLLAAGSLCAPVAGLLVDQLGMVTAGRIIMAFTSLMAIGIAIARQVTMHETSVGLDRMESLQNQASTSWVKEYLDALKVLMKNPELRTLLIIRILGAMSAVVWGTYGMIFLTSSKGAHLSEASIVMVPTISALVTIAAVFFSAERMVGRHVRMNLVLGQLIWLAGSVVFLLSPTLPVLFTGIWSMLSAVSLVLFQPALMSHWANNVEDKMRSLVSSTTNAIISIFTLPIGPIAGYFYMQDSKLPFLFTIILQVIVLIMIFTSNMKKAVRIVPIPVD